MAGVSPHIQETGWPKFIMSIIIIFIQIRAFVGWYVWVPPLYYCWWYGEGFAQGGGGGAISDIACLSKHVLPCIGFVKHIAFKNGYGYPHDGRADKNPYPHDRRADKDSYPHDSNNQCIILR